MNGRLHIHKVNFPHEEGAGEAPGRAVKWVFGTHPRWQDELTESVSKNLPSS